MEAPACALVAGRHTASLLMSLNLQRQQARFCDCVVRQRQSPGQLYPVHRCVLAASSPVLASVLASSGALVELHEPCLSGSVLALLMDYIYTGTLPYTHTLQCYDSLLTAAHYLQMDELQEALRAWKEARYADACGKTDIQSCQDSVRSTASSPGRQENQDSAEFEICDALQMHSTSMDSCLKGRETGKYHGEDDVRNESSSLNVSENYTMNLNTVKCTQVTCVTPQELVQNVSHTAEVRGESKVDKEVQKNVLQSSGIVTPQTWQKRTEMANRRFIFSSSSSSPHPCSGAVPVICHSSRAAPLHLAQVSTVPTQASVKSSRIPVPQSESTGSDSTVAGVSTNLTNHYALQYQDHRGWENRNSSDQCSGEDFGCTSGAEHPHIQEQNYNDNSADYYMEENNNNHHAHCDSRHTEHLQDVSGSWNNAHSSFSRRVKHKTELSFDDVPSKHQHLDSSDGHDVTAEKPSQQHSVVIPLPVEKSEAGSVSRNEDMRLGEANEEHGYSSRCPPQNGRHSDLFEPKKDWYKDETTAQDIVSNNRDTTQGDKRHRRIVSTTESSGVDDGAGCLFGVHHTSVEVEKMSEIASTCLTFPVSSDSDLSDPMYTVLGQSYRGHLHYHCLPQEDTHLPYRDADHKHSQPSHPDYSDQSSDEDRAGTFSRSGPSSRRRPLAGDGSEQVLLLDISAKPAELFVSYKHRMDEEENAFKNDTFGTRVRTNDREQRKEVDMTNNRGSAAKPGGESFIEGETKKEGEIVSKYHKDLMPGTDVTHNTGFTDKVSNPETDCSHPGVPDSVQDSVSLHLSDCIPSTLSVSTPRTTSAHLSTPLHPFQCFLCDRSFSQRGSLNRHVRSHLGVRPFPCPCCPMTFSRQYRVTEHMRVHQRCTQGSDFSKPPVSSVHESS